MINVHDNAPSSAQCLALTLGACCAKHVIHTLLRSVGTVGVQYHKNKQWTQSDCDSRCKVGIVVQAMHGEVVVLPSSVISQWIVTESFFRPELLLAVSESPWISAVETRLTSGSKVISSRIAVQSGNL